MFLSNPSQLATALLLLTGAMVEAQELECCSEKRVGSISYTLLSDTFDGELPSQCLNGCVYTVSGNSSKKFCFAKGDQPTECLSADSGKCIVKGSTDYYGKDITFTTFPDPQDCADYCANTLGCLYWTYFRTDTMCYVKSRRTGIVANPNAVSGNRACGTSESVQSDQFNGCCSWRNITGSAEKDGFYILSESGNNVTDQCMDGCTYTKVGEDQEQHCLSASSMDDIVTGCNSCNGCEGTDLAANIPQECKQYLKKILSFVAICTLKCHLIGCQIVGCVTDKLKDAGLSGAIDCICQVAPVC